MVKFFLEEELFKSGNRPAINLNLSVSRVGSAAQPRLMKTVGSRLKMYLAWYREMQIYSTFSTDLDINTKVVLNRGSKIIELLKQKNYSPIELDDQFILVFAGLNGFLDNIELDKIKGVEELLLNYSNTFEFFDGSLETNDINNQLADSLEEILNEL